MNPTAMMHFLSPFPCLYVIKLLSSLTLGICTTATFHLVGSGECILFLFLLSFRRSPCHNLLAGSGFLLLSLQLYYFSLSWPNPRMLTRVCHKIISPIARGNSNLSTQKKWIKDATIGIHIWIYGHLVIPQRVCTMYYYSMSVLVTVCDAIE